MRDTITNRYRQICESSLPNKKYIVFSGWISEPTEGDVFLVEAPNELMAFLSTYGETFDKAVEEFEDATGMSCNLDNLKKALEYNNDSESFVYIIPQSKIKRRTLNVTNAGPDEIVYGVGQKIF